MLSVRSEVRVTDRNHLARATQMFTAFYDEGAVRSGHLVPFNVFCESCQEMCCIDMVQEPGFTKFWCNGQFEPDSRSVMICKFYVTYSNQPTRV
jgi:hypothetical protein